MTRKLVTVAAAVAALVLSGTFELADAKKGGGWSGAGGKFSGGGKFHGFQGSKFYGGGINHGYKFGKLQMATTTSSTGVTSLSGRR